MASMDLLKLIESGKLLGLEGDSLVKFVENERSRAEKKEQQKWAREEKFETERSQRQERQEADKSDREIRTKEREMQLRERELDLREQEAELQRGTHGHNTSSRPGMHWKTPKIPPFDSTKDNMDSYILRYERYAETQEWDDEDKAIFLSTLLQGDALEVYSRMPQGDALNYNKLKDALLKRFLMTESGFKHKFYSSTQDKGETAGQFIARLGHYLDRWIDMTNIDNTYQNLKDLFVLEQYLRKCPRELATYIREHSTKDMEEVVKLAEAYLDAHHFPVSKGSIPFKNHQPNRQSKDQHEKSNYGSQTSSDEKTEQKRATFRRTCFVCGGNHFARDCTQRMQFGGSRSYTNKPHTPTTASTAYVTDTDRGFYEDIVEGKSDPVLDGLPTQYGYGNGKRVTVLWDTGCRGFIVKQDLVSDDMLTGRYKSYIAVDRTGKAVPTAVIDVDTPYYTGQVEALCLKDPICELIIGNEGKIDPKTDENGNQHATEITASAALTRGMNKRAQLKLLKVPQLPEIGTQEEFKAAQDGDSSLQPIRKMAESKKQQKRSSMLITFVKKGGLLYREVMSQKSQAQCGELQLVIPKKFRDTVIAMAHSTILAGHMGIGKTISRVLSNFYWPGMHDDIIRYCKSCDICQRTTPRGYVSRVPLEPMPVISTPFDRVAVDIVGPLKPITQRGNRYILTLVDVATRYPEAVALSTIDTMTVAEALLGIFSRVGIPREILSDNGSQFTSSMMKEIHRLMSVKSITTSPYHAQSNGLVEKYNGTLKMMLKRVAVDRPTDWDRYIEPLLFAYRETPQDSLKFSPFELLYGRTVRGPMTLLRDLWSREETSNEIETTYQYVFDLRNRLEDTCQLAEKELLAAREKQKRHFDKKSVLRTLKVDDYALLLLPTDSNKLIMQWQGPFQVVGKVGLNDYAIDVNGRRKIFHINMLKRYFPRHIDTPVPVSVAAIMFGEDDDSDALLGNEVLTKEHMPLSEETPQDVNLNPDLTEYQKIELESLVYKFKHIFSSTPGTTQLVEHNIKLTDVKPIRSKPYPLPYAKADAVRRELDAMMMMDVIEPSDSPYSSPIVLIKKSDGTHRFCVDMRKVNQVTLFDCEPTPNPEAIFARIADSKYFTKLDCCKGYWQIPMAVDAKPLTAFSTPFGHYQFKKMPFGLVNSGATYARMMRKMLHNLPDVENYVDDILIYSPDWCSHLKTLEAVFLRIQSANITMKPSKCFVGYLGVDFLGHHLEDGNRMVQDGKIHKIRDAKAPTTKKQLRSFLGLCNYVSRFIPNYANLMKPLTDLTRKGTPMKLPWNEQHTAVFNELKSLLIKEPILKLPDMQRPFILRTDASNVALGAVLLQEHDGQLFPVIYISQKLLPREESYSTIEKECMAVVWAINKLQAYLYGTNFTLETDHRPLEYLNKAKLTNHRVMRWALALQPFKFKLKSIKGVNNLGADFLSRCN